MTVNVTRASILAVGLLGLLVAPAAAHVTLHSSEAVQGGSNVLVMIRVPNEEDNATTTQLEVDFPADTPLVGVLVQPTPGWQFQVTMANLPTPVTTADGSITQYVSRVVWSGGTIPVGGYQDFDIDVSQMPTTPTLVVKALQTYSNGDIVRWIDPPPLPGEPPPDHPEPTLALTPPPAPATPSISLQGYAHTSDVHGARKLATIALAAAVVGMLLGVVGLAARPKRP